MPKKRVLILDGDPRITDIWVRIIEKVPRNRVIFKAKRLSEALEILKERAIDILITDNPQIIFSQNCPKTTILNPDSSLYSLPPKSFLSGIYMLQRPFGIEEARELLYPKKEM